MFDRIGKALLDQRSDDSGEVKKTEKVKFELPKKPEKPKPTLRERLRKALLAKFEKEMVTHVKECLAVALSRRLDNQNEAALPVVPTPELERAVDQKVESKLLRELGSIRSVKV